MNRKPVRRGSFLFSATDGVGTAAGTFGDDATTAGWHAEEEDEEEEDEEEDVAVGSGRGSGSGRELRWDEREWQEVPELVGAAIDEAFGSFDAFKEQFSAAAGGQFGRSTHLSRAPLPRLVGSGLN